MKLKSKDIAHHRSRLLTENNGYCAICCRIPYRPVLDHNHESPGNIRSTICNGCNLLVGKIENNYKRFGIAKNDLTSWLRQCATYIDFHQHNPNELVHPTYFTPEERKAKLKKKSVTKKIQINKV